MKFSLTACGGISAFLFATAPLHANPLPAEVAQTSDDLTYWYDICVKSGGQEAIDGCDRVLEITPNDETTWTNRGNALDDLGRGEEALASHDRALELAPDYSLALANRCATLGNMGRHQAAIESCVAAIEGDERWGEGGAELAWDNMGVSLAYLGQYQESLAAHLLALDLNPEYANAWNNLGATLFDLGQYAEAIQAFEEALRLDPSDEMARNNLSLARQRMNGN